MWLQKHIHLKSRRRGFHLITNEIIDELPELKNIKTGLVNLLLQHTSASLCLNENADPSVRRDFEEFFNHHIPDDSPFFQHTLEGADDMTAHLKSAILGTSLTIPVKNGKFALGTWQGIYLGEHRNSSGPRTLFVTLTGE